MHTHIHTLTQTCTHTQVFTEADSDQDGYIEFDDFAKVVMNTDIEGKLTFDF